MFKEIDVNSLRATLINSRDNLINDSSVQMYDNLKNSNVWNTYAKETFLKALDKEININYKALITKINEYIEITNLIEEYQILEKETENVLSAINMTGGVEQSLINKLEMNNRELENLKYKILNSL